MGGNRTIQVDVRIVAATNRDLKAMVEENRFRADVLSLAVFPLTVPAFGAARGHRRATRYFVQKHACRMERTIESIPTYALMLTNYDWPGNIREPQNVIERSVVLSDGPELHVALPELDGNSTLCGFTPAFECDRHIRAGADPTGVEGNQGNGRGPNRRPPASASDHPAITHAEIDIGRLYQ